jgi:CheY-like chemotaxis protein
MRSLRSSNVLQYEDTVREILYKHQDLTVVQKKILIVDDQIFNVDAILIILGMVLKVDVDVVCEKACSGEDALKKVIANVEENEEEFCSYSLILMDCNMPLMDGYEATDKIRQILFNKGLLQPIIVAVTGHTENLYI